MAKFDHSRTNSNIAFVTNFVSEESSNLPARTLVGVRRREKKLFFLSDRGVKILARMDKGVGYKKFFDGPVSVNKLAIVDGFQIQKSEIAIISHH